MLDGSSPAVRKERLLARVLVRTTLSRSDPDMHMHCRTPGSVLGWTLPHVCITCCYLGQAWDPHLRENLLSHVLVMALRRYCEGAVAPQALNFARNAAGKPRLQWNGGLTAQGTPLHFSLSHTEALLGALPGAPYMPGKRTWLQPVLKRAMSPRALVQGRACFTAPLHAGCGVTARVLDVQHGFASNLLEASLLEDGTR